MTKLRPLCLPYYYVDGKKTPTLELWPEGVTARGVTHTSDGYLLPCCWCPAQSEDFESRGFFKDSLRLDSNESVEDVICSSEWVKFVDDLYRNPNSAPAVCKKKCKVQNDC